MEKDYLTPLGRFSPSLMVGPMAGSFFVCLLIYKLTEKRMGADFR